MTEGLRWRRQVKAALGRVAFATGAYRAFFGKKAVVVLFHRIDDSLKDDPITCSRREFAAFCDFFRRYFRVVSFGELLRMLRDGDDVSCHLAITFDDGYLDNAMHAAPELRARRLPACFFIATGYIGTDRQAPWDVADGITSTWMTWDDVRRLRDDGFEIGAHTVDHVDLGVVHGTEAQRQISQSGADLERELGSPTRYFSYPFGGRENINSENYERVRRAGFECCPSAYGGIVTAESDPFRLRRTPISPWHLSPYQFGFELMVARA